MGWVNELFDRETARSYRTQAIWAAAYAVGEGLSYGLTLPVLAALLDGETASAGRWLAVLAAVAAVTMVIHQRLTVRGLRATFEAINRLHRQVARHLASLPVEWFAASRIGGLNRLIWPGAAYFTRQVLMNLAPLLRGVISPAIVLVFAAVVDWRPALVMLLASPVLLLVYRWSAAAIDRTEEESHNAHAEATARVLEFAHCQPTLRSCRSEGLGMRLLTDALDDVDDAAEKTVGREMLARTGFGTTVALALSAVVAALAWVLLDGGSDQFLVVALLVVALRFAEPLRAVADLARTLRMARANAARAQAIMDTQPLPAPAEPRLLPSGGGRGLEVALKGVRYRYSGTDEHGDWALDGVDLVVPAGSMTALVGPSGAGKSTLLRLVARFGDVEAGSVTIGGLDVREVAPRSLYGALGVVLQEVVLLEGTVRDNVLAGRPNADQDALEEAAELSGVDEILARLPLGWDTPVGSRGDSLSGGERQRISLARVALQDAPVVLLDEATAALDPVNEAVVGRWIEAMAGQRTLLVAAHQLHTVTRADAIAVVEAGRVVERGRHLDLLDAGGAYSRMWQTRREAQGWRLSSVTGDQP